MIKNSRDRLIVGLLLILGAVVVVLCAVGLVGWTLLIINAANNLNALQK